MEKESETEDHVDSEIIEAANILCLMKQTKLDPKAAREVQQWRDTSSTMTKPTSTDQSFTTSTTMESTTRTEEITKKRHIELKDKSCSNKTNKRIKPIKSESSTAQLQSIPRLPPVKELQGVLGRCSEPFTRKLTASDVSDHLIRLIIQSSNYEEFVKPLLTRKDSISAGIEITTYDEDGKEYSMVLKIWANKYYILTTAGWKQFYRDHNLGPSDVITMWMFRHLGNDNLCCAITSNKN